ncbi:S49 family peptidase [Microvirga thermotolerans]|uniref:S49 family peptidase n=2 Tax=Microvirga thermotolerans TaxID=2651334 RepID=A0A5P9K338_9HYPH|nr:S49 family peptidase [Microvirga thermotolerans]
MEQWAIDNLLQIAARENNPTFEALEAYRAKALEKADRATTRDGVAILNVEGPLFKKANLMTELCGATSYETLRRDLQASLDDSRVRAILLNIDSPGGEARGVGELATAVRAARGVKPIVAYAGDLAASAAYWIASAADRIVIGEGAALGSIGVRAAFSDTSERDAARGVKTIEFVSSQSPYKSADLNSKDGRARIQARVDALADVFVNAVAENRDASRAYVLERFGKGDVLIGKAAIDAGMADEFGTFEKVLSELAGGKTKRAPHSSPRASLPPNSQKGADEMTAQAILAARNLALGN